MGMLDKYDKKEKKMFCNEFKEFAESIGETIIEPLSNKQILNVFEHQGYWAGVTYRIKFDPGYGFYEEERTFGGV